MADLFDVVVARKLSGGGGGGGTTVEALSVTQNGTYTAPSGKAYSPVTVNVSGGSSDFSTATFTINGINVVCDKEYEECVALCESSGKLNTYPCFAVIVGGEMYGYMQYFDEGEDSAVEVRFDHDGLLIYLPDGSIINDRN